MADNPASQWQHFQQQKIALDIEEYRLRPIPRNFHGKPMPSKQQIEKEYTRGSRI